MLDTHAIARALTDAGIKPEHAARSLTPCAVRPNAAPTPSPRGSTSTLDWQGWKPGWLPSTAVLIAV